MHKRLIKNLRTNKNKQTHRGRYITRTHLIRYMYAWQLILKILNSHPKVLWENLSCHRQFQWEPHCLKSSGKRAPSLCWKQPWQHLGIQNPTNIPSKHTWMSWFMGHNFTLIIFMVWLLFKSTSKLWRFGWRYVNFGLSLYVASTSASTLLKWGHIFKQDHTFLDLWFHYVKTSVFHKSLPLLDITCISWWMFHYQQDLLFAFLGIKKVVGVAFTGLLLGVFPPIIVFPPKSCNMSKFSLLAKKVQKIP